MFHNIFKSLLFIGLFIAYVKFGNACWTPLGGYGSSVPVTKCPPIMELFAKFGKNMPLIERKFVRDSFEDRERKIVCCNAEMNVTEAFQMVGGAVLRNFAEMCGDNTNKRISFGMETTFMQYPWSALLMYDSPQRFECGGSLFTNQYVITAAHCIKHTNKLVGIRLQEHNITSEQDCQEDEGGVMHCTPAVIDLEIEKTILHPRYSKRTFDNDIALIRFKPPVRFSRTMRPICLPEHQNQEFFKPLGTITGWGVTENGTQSDVLLEADIPIHSLNHCRNVYKRRTIDDKKICASGQNAVDVCNGDSGGPLFVRVESEERKMRFMQVGVISMGVRKCGDPRDFPAIFTRISSYMDWIAESIEL